MRITIELNTDQQADLRGLTALVQALGNPGDGISLHALTAESLADDHSDQDLAIIDAAIAATDKPADAGSVDSTGLPWDERIHSNPPTTTQDGKWRKRRGVDEATVAEVTAELRGTGAPDAPLDSDPAPSNEVPDAPAPTTAPDAPVPTPPAADTASGPPAATSAGDDLPDTWPKMVQACNALGATYDKLNEVAKDVGAPGFREMKDQPGLWAMFLDMLKAA